jgi:hypothetical protein
MRSAEYLLPFFSFRIAPHGLARSEAWRKTFPNCACRLENIPEFRICLITQAKNQNLLFNIGMITLERFHAPLRFSVRSDPPGRSNSSGHCGDIRHLMFDRCLTDIRIVVFA